MKSVIVKKASVTVFGLLILSVPAHAAQSGGIQVLRDALFGAGVGAISAEASGGKAGKGALIGAGVQVIGQTLLGIFTAPSSQSQPVYTQPAPTYTYSQPVYQQPAYQQPVYQQPVYQPAPQPIHQTRTVYTYEVQPTYVQQPAPVYYSAPSYEDPNKRILKQGLMGAGVGAISAEASGGKAGSGALIGAGTNVIGSALLELLTG